MSQSTGPGSDPLGTYSPGIDPLETEPLGADPLTQGYAETGAHTAPGTPSGTGGSAKETAQETADAAKHQAGAVAGTAKEQASAVAGSAKEQAGNVLAEAKDQAGDLLGDLRRQLAEQSDTLRDRIAEFLTEAGSELEHMAGAGGRSGYATQLVRQVGDRASSWGSHLTNHGSADLLEQTRGFARRRPGAFVLGALVAGVAAGRLTRGAKAHHDDTTDTTGTAVATTTPAPYAAPTTTATSGPAGVPTLTPPVEPLGTGTRPTAPYGDEFVPVDTPADPREFRP
ncbi:hypothetical protein [Kineococcus rhizosphaerae]|uniref:Uncharacterized protein n=1 Tax=Kineococcus rhizosphaerae TaxID=559628 RepID=A0A2T0QXE6_9ACTN|nr:hypothetical protein [Kineococcus rhizosphaerae]PRY10552.1 hypothetical protein CLV37_116105 [Kineococcus rhizosphaerae]